MVDTRLVGPPVSREACPYVGQASEVHPGVSEQAARLVIETVDQWPTSPPRSASVNNYWALVAPGQEPAAAVMLAQMLDADERAELERLRREMPNYV